MKTISSLLLAAVATCQCTAQTSDTAAGKPRKQLQTVTVTAKTPMVRQEADRIIYDLQADPQSKVSSVLDMMRKVPHLSVDADDKLLLKGSSGYKVFINGRPSGLVERNPKDVLRSMPASTIKSIEVITNPPAKYDAEGLAGIINIVTYRQLHNGYRGAANIYKKAPAGGPGGGGSFTVKRGKTDISVLAGLSRYDVPETYRELRRTATDSSMLHQHTLKHSNSHTAYVSGEWNYAPDSLDLISLQLNWNKTEATKSSKQLSVMTGAAPLHYQLDNNNQSRESGIDVTANYQRGFKTNKDRLLTFSYRYRENSNRFDNDIVLSNEINYSVPDYQQHNAAGSREHTTQVDYVQPVKKLVIEGGLKGISREHNSAFEYQYLDAATDRYETDRTRSNMFHSSHNIVAAYNRSTYGSERSQLKAGLRAEQTVTNIHSDNSLAPLRQLYLNVLPSIVIERKFNKNHSLSFTFSKRIQRPSAEELNPFVDRSNPNFESGGNPYLLPITSDAYQLGYLISGKGTFNVSIGHMYFNRIITAFPFYDPYTDITFSRHENFGKCKVYKTNLSLRYPITEKWNFALESDIRHVTIYGTANNISFKNSGPGVYLYASTGYRFEKGWRANADITYKMGGIMLPIGTTNGFVASSFSVNKDIVGSRLAASAAVNNPFTKYRYVDETITSINFTQSSRNQSYYRRFTFSMNYRFGKLKEETRKNRRGIKNDDASG